ncbi:MAG: hypothetical protein COB04_17955 [Gammaproteobacteria bacterium]|nr:MAG: hypothetical protein COB04_17955 [Gammaproteobacteria bacterium]
MSDPYTRSKFGTDTATIAVFDPAALAHRCGDDADWWSIPRDEISEINQGNVLFVGLGCDGGYEVDIYQNIGESECPSKFVSANVRVLSGCIYIGAGEQVPAGDFGPETTYGGTLIYAEKGTIEVRIYSPESGKLIVEYCSTDNEAKNDFKVSPAL